MYCQKKANFHNDKMYSSLVDDIQKKKVTRKIIKVRRTSKIHCTNNNEKWTLANTSKKCGLLRKNWTLAELQRGKKKIQVTHENPK